MKVTGLNKLKGFNVTEFDILLQPGSDGANMVGKVFIPNPSVMTLEMVGFILIYVLKRNTNVYIG